MKRVLSASLILLVLMAGCASVLKDVRIAENTAADTVTLGYKALNAYDKIRLGEIHALAESGNLSDAISGFTKYTGLRSKAFDALDAASHLLDATDKMADALAAGIAKPSDLLAQIPLLIQAALDVKNALAEMGVKL